MKNCNFNCLFVAPDLNTTQIKAEIMMRRVARWMGEHGLQLALAKTETVIISGRRIETIVPIRFGDQVIETKPSAMYFGVTIGTKLTFAEHLRKVTEKTSIRVGQLSQLMANTSGSRPQARWLLMMAMHLFNPAVQCRSVGGRHKGSKIQTWHGSSSTNGNT